MWLLRLLLYFPADVRPKFLNHQCDGVITHLRSPHAGCIGHGAVGSGMVTVSRNARGDGAAKDFGNVELIVSGVSASNEDAADGVAGAIPEGAASGLKVAGILAEHGRKNCAGKKILDGAIGKIGAIALAISFGALPVAWFAVLRLADS